MYHHHNSTFLHELTASSSLLVYCLIFWHKPTSCTDKAKYIHTYRGVKTPYYTEGLKPVAIAVYIVPVVVVLWDDTPVIELLSAVSLCLFDPTYRARHTHTCVCIRSTYEYVSACNQTCIDEINICARNKDQSYFVLICAKAVISQPGLLMV